MTGPDAIERLTNRYMIRRAALRVCSSPSFRNRSAALRDLTPRTLAAFADGFYLANPYVKLSFGKVLKKLGQLVTLFKKLPKLWDLFKAKLGIKSLSDLPRAIERWISKGRDFLKRALAKMFQFPPLSIYTLGVSQKLLLQTWIEYLVNKFPRFRDWLKNKAKPRVDQFERWFRDALPVVSGAIIAAIALWIWWEVVEYEWNLQDLLSYLTDAFTGRVILADLLSYLPGFGVGFILRLLGIGWDNPFSLWPPLLVAQIVVLLSNRYLIWTGKGFKLNEDQIRKDFDTASEGIRSLIPGRTGEVIDGL